MRFTSFFIPYRLMVLILVFPVSTLFSQELSPPIHNYTSNIYSAASQNWDIDVDKEGVVYAANNQGLLSFDGQSWELFPLPKGSIIRSVFVYGDKIFTGSYKEFGYWKRDTTGKLFYTSLIPKLGKYAMQSEEFWEILEFNGDIYFRSFGAIYKYDHNTIEPVQNVVSNNMIVYKDKLLLAVRKKGVFSLDKNNNLQKLPNQEILEKEEIVDMAIQGEDLIIGTRERIFKYSNKQCTLLNAPKLQEELSRAELNHIMAINNNRVLLGTVKNGIIDYDKASKTYSVLNRNNGLQNNTILGFVEKYGNIWLALDNGIDRVEFNSSVQFYTDDTGELGAVYDLAFYKNKMFLASNTGVYTFNNNQLEIIEGAEGHTWNLEILHDTLYVNHNTGTYYLFQDNLIPIETSTGSFKIDDLPFTSNEYLISSYTGIRNYSRKDDSIYSLDSLNFPVKNIVYENENVLWAAHPYEGLYRVGLNNNFKETQFIDKINIPDGGNNINTNAFLINNQLAIFNGDQWFKYNSFKDSLQVFDELRAFRKYKMLLKDANTYWFSHTENNSLRFTNFSGSNIIIAPGSLDNRLVKNHENIIKSGDSVYYIPLNDGFARIDLMKFIKNSENIHVSVPRVIGFLDSEKRYNLENNPEVPYQSSRDLNIYTSFPVSGALSLEYRLKGEDTLSGVVNNGKVNLQNLNHGDYELQLLAVGPQGNFAKKHQFNFSIKPPWYLSNLMKLVYLLIILSLILLVYWFNQLKLKKHQLLLEEKFEKEHQERLNNLEKERLKNQITLKRKELANTTMVAAKKNEMLMEIQSELTKDKNKLPNQFKMKHILNKINRAIKNKDEWQVFETNFNELHEDFFKDILDSYPNLTSKDLKLCSYLKMNLTSKEIAPLMGISVRGIEVHRYRLRKKMNLDKKENLTNFFIKNF